MADVQSPLSLVDDEQDQDMLAGSDDYAPGSQVAGAGGLSALDIPGAAQALATMARSSAQARQALERARQEISARKYDRSLPWFALSSALSKPTRTGAIGEVFGNVSEALSGPVRERAAFKANQQKELLGLDTQIAGLDQNAATAQLQLAALQAKLANASANAGNDRIIDENGVVRYAAHGAARGQHAWTPPGTVTNVNMKEEGEESKTVGKGMGDLYVKTQLGGFDANAQIAKYERLGQLMEGVNTGKLAPTFAQLAALAESFGLKIDPKLGAKQAIEALSNEVALTLRNPQGGAGMPGALSDEDRKFLSSMTPGLGKTPEGNRLIIETAIKLARRDQEVAKLMRAYRKKHGHLDEDFFDELDDFSKANPLFGPKPNVLVPPPAQTQASEVADVADPSDDVADPIDTGAPPSADDAAATNPGTISFYSLRKKTP